jgi:hypothetical protein
VKCEALRAGYNVFTLISRTADTLSELDRLLKEIKPLLLVIDGYPVALDLIDYFARHAPEPMLYCLLLGLLYTMCSSTDSQNFLV